MINSPFSAFPPKAVPTELVTAVGPFKSAPLVGQIALDKNIPLLRPSGVAIVRFAAEPAQKDTSPGFKFPTAFHAHPPGFPVSFIQHTRLKKGNFTPHAPPVLVIPPSHMPEIASV